MRRTILSCVQGSFRGCVPFGCIYRYRPCCGGGRVIQRVTSAGRVRGESVARRCFPSSASAAHGARAPVLVDCAPPSIARCSARRRPLLPPSQLASAAHPTSASLLAFPPPCPNLTPAFRRSPRLPSHAEKGVAVFALVPFPSAVPLPLLPIPPVLPMAPGGGVARRLVGGAGLASGPGPGGGGGGGGGRGGVGDGIGSGGGHGRAREARKC